MLLTVENFPYEGKRILYSGEIVLLVYFNYARNNKDYL